MAIGTLAALGLGAGLGLGKHFLVDQPRYKSAKKLAAETQRYSPWTGLKATAPESPSAFESGIGGAGYGLSSLGTVNDAIGKYGLVQNATPPVQMMEMGAGPTLTSDMLVPGMGMSQWEKLMQQSMQQQSKPSLYT